MARETADAFAVAAHSGAENEMGLAAALGRHLEELDCPHAEVSLVLAAYRAGIPCTVHVALGTDIVHMHPHVSGAALGEASLIDFRRLCSVVATLAQGVWMNLGSAVVLPEVFSRPSASPATSAIRWTGWSRSMWTSRAQYRSRGQRARSAIERGDRADRPSRNPAAAVCMRRSLARYHGRPARDGEGSIRCNPSSHPHTPHRLRVSDLTPGGVWLLPGGEGWGYFSPPPRRGGWGHRR